MPAENSTSFVQIPSEILIDPEISALDLRIYAILMDFGFKGRGWSQIGHKYLGRLVGKHPQTIAKSLKRLTELGYISIDRIGLNRNDRIRCRKTVPSQNRSERRSKIKKTSQQKVPLLQDRSTKKRYKTSHSNPKPTTDQKDDLRRSKGVRSSVDDEAILKHQPITDRLRDRLNTTLRPASVACWFKDMAVINDDDTSTTISVGRNQVDWIDEHYSKLLDKVAEKKVNIVI